MKKLIIFLMMALAMFAISCNTDPAEDATDSENTTLAEKAGTYNGIVFADEPDLKGNAKAVIADDGKAITFDLLDATTILDTSADAEKKGTTYGPYTITGGPSTVVIDFIFIDETSATVNISISDGVTATSSSVFTKS